ncbi:MAG: Phytanoyl-CoA dioxygenase [Acidimicrobiales bacterium]|nr:Phytanoyl-CoA dioxygenase [Acidimicrobiales bacterium]
MTSPRPADERTPGRYCTVDPLDRPLDVPTTVDDDAPAYTPDLVRELRQAYDDEGYVVVRGVLDADTCAAANTAFDRDVKPDPRPYYRLSGRPERHVMTEHGFMRDGIRDVQSLDPRRAPSMRRVGTETVTHPALTDLVAAVLDAPAQVVQTMYFEGNPATQPHQDTYYLDAEEQGRMVAAWIATEDIAPGAGRFYVAAGSHRADLPGNAGPHAITDHHDRYLAAVADLLRTDVHPIHAPALAAGDVLLWNARTVHGSLPTSQPERSRRSFTAHFIPASSRFLQWQHRIVPLELSVVNGTPVHHPKDVSRLKHRARYLVETRAPGVAAAVKARASRRVVRP